MVGKTDACEECVRACQLMHRSKKDRFRVTRFFKIMIGTDFDEALLFPPKFAKTVKDLVDQEIKVEDSDGACWTITLSYHNNLLAFHKGWSKFSDDKGLWVGDFVVVNHIKRGHFVVQVFGRDGCEKLKAATQHLPVKRAQTSENLGAESMPCQTTRGDAKRRKSSRTSVQTQQTEKDCVPNSDGGNKEQICMDNELYLMVDRDQGYVQSDYRTCLYDLSSFEIKQDICSAENNNKGIDGQEGGAYRAQTMNFQADENLVGKKPTERVVSRTETEIINNIVEDNNDSGPKGDMPFEHNQVHLDGLDYDIPSVVAPVSFDMSNVVIPCQSPNKSSGSSTQNPSSIGRNFNKEFQMVEKDKVEKTEQASPYGRNVSEQSMSEEGANSFAAPEMINVVKTEPVDELETSITCLAETNGSVYVDLQDRGLPSVSFQRGRQDRAAVILEDPEGREWGGMYHNRCGFHLLVAPWRKITEVHAIQRGDRLTFTVTNASMNKYKFGIVRDQPGN